MHKQIKDLFTNTQTTMTHGLWFSGYRDEGELKQWYENGQLCVQCFRKNGQKDGEYKLWDRTGELKYHLLYKNDKVIKDYLK